MPHATKAKQISGGTSAITHTKGMIDANPDVQLALEVAVQCHRDQWRDGEHPLPYLHHPIDVLGNLRYIGGVKQPAEWCAAILHDTVEEGGVTLKELEEKFGRPIADRVRELTRSEPEPDLREKLKGEDWVALRSKLLLNDISKMSPEAQTIKLADRLSNLREAMLVRTPGRLSRYVLQTRRILQIIDRGVNPMLWDEVERVCDEAEARLDAAVRSQTQ